jgi:hypothetical protein
LLITAGLYGLVRLNRDELVDFTVPHRAAGRFLAHEPLYRPSDGHYQYKYLPTFAAVMVPFTLVPKRVAEVAWFTLTVMMTWGFARLSVAALPDRRLSVRVLFWLVLFLNGKFLVKELAFGQFNLPVALLPGAVNAPHNRGPGRRWRCGSRVRQPRTRSSCCWPLGWRCCSFGLVLGCSARRIVCWNGNLTLSRVVSHGDRRRRTCSGRHPSRRHGDGSPGPIAFVLRSSTVFAVAAGVALGGG